MSKLLSAVLSIVIAYAGATVAARSMEAPFTIAVSRCNSQMIDSAAERVRDYDRHPPAGNSKALVTRYGAIADVVSTLTEERGILNSVCSNDAQKTPLFAQIAAISAWAIALESDIASRLNASCPAAIKAFPTIMLADAWLSLANVVNENNGTVPTEFGEVIPKIQSRAQAVGLALPAWPDTSQYWRDQLDAKEKPIIQGCPSPSPSPTP